MTALLKAESDRRSGLIFACKTLKHGPIIAILAVGGRPAMGKSDLVSEPSVAFARSVDWNLFKVFHEIARRGGIGAAARALNKKQPSITAALRRPEEQVGTTLCTRTPRGVELTVHGHQLLGACESLQASVRNIPRAISAACTEVSGTVTLRVLSNLYNLTPLTGIFDDFHTRYPRIEIRLDVAPW